MERRQARLDHHQHDGDERSDQREESPHLPAARKAMIRRYVESSSRSVRVEYCSHLRLPASDGDERQAREPGHVRTAGKRQPGVEKTRLLRDIGLDENESGWFRVASSHAGRIRLGAISLAISALLLAAFPLFRPFGDRSSNPAVVAETFTSASWLAAHILGALGFILLPVGLFGLYNYLRDSPVDRLTFHGLILSWFGVGLFLPIFGSEAFALRAIGNAAIHRNNTNLLILAHSIRTGPQFGFVISGLLLLAIGAILIGVAVWKSSTLPKWGGVLLAIGLVFFLPLLPQVARVIDGLLTGVGGMWIALSMLLRMRNEH